METVDKEPSWRHKGKKLTTGYTQRLRGAIYMAIKDLPATATGTQPSRLVEMSWDPITRIVGSLGIYTKIDFQKKIVAECHATSSIFRGYSIFMRGKDPARRALHHVTHLRDLRR